MTLPAIALLMLSIAKLAIGSAHYYIHEDHHENYYGSEEVATSAWWGGGLEALGIRPGEKVNPTHLRRLCAGFSCDGNQKLVQNAGRFHGKRARQPGADFTFSVFKSASIVACLDEQLGVAISDCAHRAVDHVLERIEHGARVARGSAGRIQEPAKLVVAKYLHWLSRAGQCHLHVHALVLNLGVRGDGTIGSLRALDSRTHELGAMFQDEFAKLLREELGLRIARDPRHEWSYRIEGIPPELEKELSKRAAEAKEWLANNPEGASHEAAAATRKRKPRISHPELVVQTREAAIRHGFSLDMLRTAPPDQAPSSKNVPGQNHRQAELRRETAEHVDRRQPSSRRQEQRQAMLSAAKELGARIAHDSAASRTIRTLKHHLKGILAAHAPTSRIRARRASLSIEQVDAVEDVVASQSRLCVVTGEAESGKTKVVATAAKTFSQCGYRVHVLATTLLAKRRLEELAGMPATTLQGFIRNTPSSFSEKAHYHSRQLVRQALGRRGVAPISLSKDSVIVVDGADIASGKQLTQLLQAAGRANARVVLAGRTGEGAWEFSRLADLTSDGARWSETRPAHIQLDRGDDLDASQSTRRSIHSPELVLRRSDAKRRNIERHLETPSTWPRVVDVGGQSIYEGEPVILRSNCAHLGIRGGDTGVVRRIKKRPRIFGGDTLTVELDRLERQGLLRRHVVVHVPLREYARVELAHALTIRAAQGTPAEQRLQHRLHQDAPDIELNP